MLPVQLATEVEELRRAGMNIELIEAEGVANVVFPDYALPAGYSAATTTLLLRVQLSYPNGQPDMFWTSPNLTRSNGTAPQSADQFEDHIGQRWRRFSWHPQRWNPATDNLQTYLEFVNAGLAKAAR